MNNTQKMIVMDLAEHPGCSVGDIAKRINYSPHTVRRYLGKMTPILIVSRRYQGRSCGHGGPRPVRYTLRDGIVNWCPHCGHVMERVRP